MKIIISLAVLVLCVLILLPVALSTGKKMKDGLEEVMEPDEPKLGDAEGEEG